MVDVGSASVSASRRADEEPRPVTVAFVTAEHSTLQSSRASTIAESTGRATMFLGSVSGGLIALGLVATATQLGTAFYAFSLVLLPLLAFVGVVTFERTLQSGIFDQAPTDATWRADSGALDGNYPEIAGPQAESLVDLAKGLVAR